SVTVTTVGAAKTYSGRSGRIAHHTAAINTSGSPTDLATTRKRLTAVAPPATAVRHTTAAPEKTQSRVAASHRQLPAIDHLPWIELRREPQLIQMRYERHVLLILR